MVVLTAKFKTEPTDLQVYREIELKAFEQHLSIKGYEIRRAKGIWMYRLAVDEFDGGVITVYKIGTSGRSAEFERKIKKQHDSIAEYASTHGCSVTVAQFVSCNTCHSKISTAAYRDRVATHDGWRCPICGHTLESMTFTTNINRRKAKLDKLLEQYKNIDVKSTYFLAVCHISDFYSQKP